MSAKHYRNIALSIFLSAGLLVASLDARADQPMGPERAQAEHFNRLDRNGDGKISRREFPGPKDHFDRFDRNGDGFLSRSETPPPPPLDFDRMDADRDGRISKREFPGPEDRFNRLDRNGDKFLERDEVPGPGRRPGPAADRDRSDPRQVDRADRIYRAGRAYQVVDTGQTGCYDQYGRSIDCPGSGQDGAYAGRSAEYRDLKNGIVLDLNTGLMWQQSPDLSRRISWDEAVAGAKSLNLGGHADWRLPTIKELYSLILFTGSNRLRRPYINTDYFDFVWGDQVDGGRSIDSQFWSSTLYAGSVMNGRQAAFGVNFADGRIKGYPTDPRRGKFARYVRGNPAYGKNKFIDRGDGTVFDAAAGLIWQQADSGRAMNWPAALDYAENLALAGKSDWRLPNAKELQSIVDYSRAPDAIDPARRGPAIDPIFQVSSTEAWYWTGTNFMDHGRADEAVYIAFGRALGNMAGRFGGATRFINVHGAGAQRSDPKTGDPSRYASGRGPQGDEIRINNYVRCVRGGLD